MNMSCCRAGTGSSRSCIPTWRLLVGSRQQWHLCYEGSKVLVRRQQRRRSFSSSSSSSSSSPSSSTSSQPRTELWGSNPLSQFLQWYSQQLDHRPLLTKGLTSGLIAASGDVICQLLSNNNNNNNNKNRTDKDDGRNADTATASADPTYQKNLHNSVMGNSPHNDTVTTTTSTSVGRTTNKGWDEMRTFRFFVMGGLWVGPVTHYWYTTLSTRLVPGSATWGRTVQRLLLDQFAFAPIFAPSFMGLLWLLEGKDSIQLILNRLYVVSPELIVSGWKLWIPTMGVNFSIVPIKYQVLFSNVVSLVWNVYLSYVSSLSSPTTTRLIAKSTSPTTTTTAAAAPDQ